MDVARFHAGDLGVLRLELLKNLGTLWRLLRRGFVIEDEGKLQVLGIEDFGELEALLVATLTKAFAPVDREAIRDEAALVRSLVEKTAEAAIRAAERGGRKISVQEDPFGVVDIQRLAAGEAVAENSGPTDPGLIERWAADRAELEQALTTLGEDQRRIVALRIVEGESLDETAKVMGKGRPFVAQRERRARRTLRHVLAKEGRSVSDAELEALLSNRADGPPQITAERIADHIFRRVFVSEPAPYSQRAPWAIGALAFGAAGWIGIVSGVLPGPHSDKFPTPSVELVCEGECHAGSTAKARIIAPRDTRSVAVVNVRGEVVTSLVTDPAGGSIALPIGAKTRATMLPYPVVLSETSSVGELVAVFSKKDLTASAIREATRSAVEDVLVVRTPIVRGR